MMIHALVRLLVKCRVYSKQGLKRVAFFIPQLRHIHNTISRIVHSKAKNETVLVVKSTVNQ